MTPIERAARALFEYEPGPYGDCVEWAIEQDFGWRDQVDAVKLVLTAIREPSEAMKLAGRTSQPFITPEGQRPWTPGQIAACAIWEDMIDAALAEEG